LSGAGLMVCALAAPANSVVQIAAKGIKLDLNIAN
jgi:hypothetical protein